MFISSMVSFGASSLLAFAIESLFVFCEKFKSAE